VDLTVWVDGWQLQCCGESFAVRSQVSWRLGDAARDCLGAVLGARAAGVDAAEEHHAGLPEEVPKTAATVSGISAVHCRYAPAPGGDSKVLYPVRDSAVVTEQTRADGWTSDRGDLRFARYLVDLVTATS
jgi:hypothetical protein